MCYELKFLIYNNAKKKKINNKPFTMKYYIIISSFKWIDDSFYPKCATKTFARHYSVYV